MKEIHFCKIDEPYGAFSNFSHHVIKLDGKEWPSSEHYFQAQKFTDVTYQEKIRAADSPMSAMRLGQSRDVPLVKNWFEGVRDEVMYKVVWAKVQQHQEVRDLLLSTGEAPIAEHRKADSYWGDGGDGSGQNKLGKILMKIRSELVAEQAGGKAPAPTPETKLLYAGKHLLMKAVGHWEYASRTKAAGAVAILAVTPQDEVILIEQFRPPVGKRVVELPAGLVGDTDEYKGEAFLVAAQRELLEETGYEASQWKRVFHGPSSAGLSTEEITFFLANGLVSKGPALGDGHEELELHLVPRKEIITWLASKESAGLMIDYKIYAALFFWDKVSW